MTEEQSIEALRLRSPGVDPENPYDGIDVDTLPEWWRRAIEEFEAHDLRPYRPPRFEDGKLAHHVINSIEREYDISICFVSVDTNYREQWTIRVDEEPVGTVDRHRSPDGYTVYEIESDEFRSLLRDAADEE